VGGPIHQAHPSPHRCRRRGGFFLFDPNQEEGFQSIQACVINKFMSANIKDAIVNVNGQIIAPPNVLEQAKVSVFDRSFLYGDSLYEVARTYKGKLFAVKEHLERLEKSAGLCRMILGQSLDL